MAIECSRPQFSIPSTAAITDGIKWLEKNYHSLLSNTNFYTHLLLLAHGDFTFTFHFHALEKEMATHSGVLAWRIPGTGEPGGLPSMGSHRVGHD